MPHLQRFCVIAQARSGSEYFTTRLNEHPDIACHRELFNRRTVYTAFTGADKARAPTVEWRDAHPLEAVEEVFKMSGDVFPTKRLFGFKLFLLHSQEVRRQVRADLAYKLIVLERKNKLAQFVSIATARETGRWSAFADKAAATSTAAVEVSIADLQRFAELEQQRYRQFNERIKERTGVMHVESETLDAQLAGVLDFLEVDVAPELRVVRTRQNPSRLSERVRNWDQVVDWLKRNGHAAWAEC